MAKLKAILPCPGRTVWQGRRNSCRGDGRIHTNNMSCKEAKMWHGAHKHFSYVADMHVYRHSRILQMPRILMHQ